ncbi:hypothetical protein FRC17_001629, partial [Serendipita sp. 399]
SKPAIPGTANYLPPEILELVFQYLPRRPPCHGFQRGSLLTECWSIVRVCRSWYGPATRAAYEAVSPQTYAATVKFSKALERGPHLQSLVKTLVLPTRGRRCPPTVTKLYLQIVDKLNVLEEVRVAVAIATVPFSGIAPVEEEGLPLELTNHRDTLTALCLHKFVSFAGPFDPAIAETFRNLQFLDLEGFRIDENAVFLDPLPPPLLQLRAVAFTYRNVAHMLDGWLITCPNLTGLRFRKTVLKNNMMTLKVLSHHKITHLSILSCICWQMHLPGFFSVAFSNVKRVELSTTTFVASWAQLPLALEHLRLEYTQRGAQDLITALDSYLKIAVVDAIFLSIETHFFWFEGSLVALCRKHSVKLEIDSTLLRHLSKRDLRPT